MPGPQSRTFRLKVEAGSTACGVTIPCCPGVTIPARFFVTFGPFSGSGTAPYVGVLNAIANQTWIADYNPDIGVHTFLPATPIKSNNPDSTFNCTWYESGGVPGVSAPALLQFCLDPENGPSPKIQVNGRTYNSAVVANDPPFGSTCPTARPNHFEYSRIEITGLLSGDVCSPILATATLNVYVEFVLVGTIDVTVAEDEP